MRRAAAVTGIGCVSILLLTLSGCSSGRDWKEWFPSRVKTLPNSAAIDRALRLCSLTEGEQPFHLILEIAPPAHASQMHAEIEVFWLNRITYRIVIRSAAFTQTRIVNSGVVEEHDTGSFYPRWIQNFADALLEPVPKAAELRKVPGALPVESASQACITAPFRTGGNQNPDADVAIQAQACFAGAEPKITSGRDPGRYVAFDDFEPFGSQQIARTLVNDLPDNTLMRARVLRLEPLAQADYGLVKAKEFTPVERQIATALVSKGTAESMLEPERDNRFPSVSRLPSLSQQDGPVLVYIRTDRTGVVREAYFDSSGHVGTGDALADAVASRALTLKFKPLVVHGVGQQMEATIALPGS